MSVDNGLAGREEEETKGPGSHHDPGQSENRYTPKCISTGSSHKDGLESRDKSTPAGWAGGRSEGLEWIE